jgi:septum formation protein
MTPLPILLASKSPRRKDILTLANVPFEIFSIETNEDFPTDLSIEDIPIHIAYEKVRAVKPHHPNRIILGADTVVVLNETIIGKPKNREDACKILGELSGKVHQVITGVVMVYHKKEISFSTTTEVEFHSISTEEIEFYVDTYQPYDKAGAYAIQEWIGAIAIKRINGCFYNVMGLPMSELMPYLKEISKI